MIDNSPTALTPSKGDIAITIGGDVSTTYPRGLVIGTVVRSPDPGSRQAELRPVVDLDALTLVKVLKYPPAVTP
jgi:cell shape-determining protein MreC